MWAWVSGGVYRNWCRDVLEGSFALNLTILAAATSYVDRSQGAQLAVGYTSVSIALATFIGILAYHIFQQLRHTKLWKKVPKLNRPNKLIGVGTGGALGHVPPPSFINCYINCSLLCSFRLCSPNQKVFPTPLLVNEPADNPAVKVADFSRLRESLLEDLP